MRRTLLSTLVWILLLPVVGGGRLLWSGLRTFAAFRGMTVLTLFGAAAALSVPNPLSAGLADAGIWPPGHGILVKAGMAVGIGMLYHGLRSPGLWRLHRKLRRTS